MHTFAWFLGLILLGLAAIAVFTYPTWLLLHPYFDFPFHRIGERLGMLALLGGFLLTARHLGLRDRTSLGYGAAPRAFLRALSIGLALGVASMAAAVAIMTGLGLLDWSAAADLTAPAAAKLMASRLASGIAVAFIEETFLRGAMLTGIERESGSTAAVCLTALVYSGLHFFASFRVPAAQVTPWSGVDLLAGTLQLFAHPLTIGDAFLCLFAVGVVLGNIRVATGNIAAGVGLHAGWVWVMLLAHACARPLPGATLSFLLSRFDGFVGWLVLAWTMIIGIGLQRFYAGGTGVKGASVSSR